MITFWKSEEAIRAFAGHDISAAKYYDFDKDFLIECMISAVFELNMEIRLKTKQVLRNSLGRRVNR
jgi:hypothetical protein